jgi:hypothetical protein
MTPLRGSEYYVKRNSAIGGSTLARNDKTVQAVATQQLQAGEPKTGLTETGRKYKVHVIVTDPNGLEVLNLTSLALESILHNNGYPGPDIQQALQVLIEAAGEWSA